MDSWLTNGSEKRGVKEVNLEVRIRIGDIVNIEAGITIPLL